MVKATKEYHVALEVNNSSLVKGEKERLNCIENIKTFLKLCMENKVYIIVSSDAHDPSTVGQVNLALDLIQEIGFDESLILNNDICKFKKFICI